jgi:hypothetical protein
MGTEEDSAQRASLIPGPGHQQADIERRRVRHSSSTTRRGARRTCSHIRARPAALRRGPSSCTPTHTGAGSRGIAGDASAPPHPAPLHDVSCGKVCQAPSPDPAEAPYHIGDIPRTSAPRQCTSHVQRQVQPPTQPFAVQPCHAQTFRQHQQSPSTGADRVRDEQAVWLGHRRQPSSPQPDRSEVYPLVGSRTTMFARSAIAATISAETGPVRSASSISSK